MINSLRKSFSNGIKGVKNMLGNKENRGSFKFDKEGLGDIKKSLRRHIPLFLLIGGIFSLVLLSELISDKKLHGDENIYLAVMAIEMVVFVLPAMMFCRYRGMEFVKKTNLRLPALSSLPFVFFSLLFLIFSNVLITLLIFSGSSPVDGTTSTITLPSINNGSVDIIGVIIVFAIIPAVCEEFVFRCVLMSEFKKYGYLTAIVITSLLFSMVHFSKEGFMVYFFSGLVLGITAYVTRSVAASMILHALYNMYGLFLESGLWGAISRNVNIVLVVFIAVVIVLISLMVALGEAQRMFMDYSATAIPPPESYINRDEVEDAESKIRARRIRSITAFVSPGVIVATAIFLFVLFF